MWVDTTALKTQVVDIDYVNNTVNFLTDDETIVNTITFELEEKFG